MVPQSFVSRDAISARIGRGRLAQASGIVSPPLGAALATQCCVSKWVDYVNVRRKASFFGIGSPPRDVVDAIAVLVGDAGKGMAHYGLPRDLSKGSIEGWSGELRITTETYLSNQFRRFPVDRCVEDVTFQTAKAGAEVSELVTPEGSFFPADDFVQTFNARQFATNKMLCS